MLVLMVVLVVLVCVEGGGREGVAVAPCPSSVSGPGTLALQVFFQYFNRERGW